MSNSRSYFETKLSEARSLLEDPPSELISIKLRPTRDGDSNAYAYPCDYKDLDSFLHQQGLQVIRDGWVSRGKAKVYRDTNGTTFVLTEHETGPEVILAATVGAALGGLIVALLGEFVRSVQKNDQSGERYYNAEAISVEKRTDSDGSQLLVIHLPASRKDVEMHTDDFSLRVFGDGRRDGFSREKIVGNRGESLVILFMGANPTDQTQLALTAEAQAIDNYLRTTDRRDDFRVEQQWELQAQQVPGKIMRFKPTVVHFSGHGSPNGSLIFVDDTGIAREADPVALAEVFRLLNDKVRCVVLNACYSESQAIAIAQHVEVVVGMSDAIGDADAITFSRAFYEALGYGKSVHDAFELAKVGIALSDLRDADLPKIHFRTDVDPRTLHLCGNV